MQYFLIYTKVHISIFFINKLHQDAQNYEAIPNVYYFLSRGRHCVCRLIMTFIGKYVLI